MTLVTPPSFNSPEPLSARFLYKRVSQGGSASDWVLGTTGREFMRVAWEALKRFQFDHKDAYATMATDGRTGPLGLFFGSPMLVVPGASRVVGQEVSRTFSIVGERQTFWDNDFNRALWSWTYQQWVASRRARGLDSPRTIHRQRLARLGALASPLLVPLFPVLAHDAIEDTRRDMETPEFRTWWGLLDAIEQCELEQRVNVTALRVACTLVALRFQLIARTDASYVALLSNETVPPPYNRTPANPDPGAEVAGRAFKTWPEGRGESAGMFLTDDPERPTPSTPPAQGQPAPAEAPGVPGVHAPISSREAPPPVAGMSAAKATGITIGYTVGTAMVIAGIATAIVKGGEESSAPMLPGPVGGWR